MPASLRSALFALVPLALTACPKPGPPPTSVSQHGVTATASDATCMLGVFQVQVQQRMIQDDGITALLEDQRIGDTAILFTAQRDAITDHRPGDDPSARPTIPQPPQTLLLARGSMVTRTLDDIRYVDRNGARPTETTTARQTYTFFLADAAWDCSEIRDSITAIPTGPSAEACLDASVRSGCQPVRLDA